jgi:hypothetical protein
MSRFNKIEEIDNEYFELYKLVTEDVRAYLADCDTSKSVFNLIKLTNYINFLKNALFDLYETDNIIAINVIFRSIIDYYLRFQYLSLRLVEEKNDNATIEYMKDSYNLDVINQIKSLKFIKEKLKSSTLNDIDFTNAKLKSIDKYSYKKLIEFIVNKTQKKRFS